VNIVIDASAIVALGMDEPERLVIEAAKADADEVCASPLNLLEAGIVLALRFGRFTPPQYATWLEEMNVIVTDVVSVAALRAYLQYGKGVHRAGLNLGDCFAYALARQLEAPLLFKGEDFVFTDISSAIQPT
jgi:ribonuclease VapC